MRVVETLNEFKDGGPRLGMGPEDRAIQELTLKGGEERFSDGVGLGSQLHLRATIHRKPSGSPTPSIRCTREFTLVAYRHTWGEDRVYFHLGDEDLHSLPASWTDVGPADPFVTIAAERALFRYADLLALVRLLQELDQGAA